MYCRGIPPFVKLQAVYLLDMIVQLILIEVKFKVGLKLRNFVSNPKFLWKNRTGLESPTIG
jgi:hypothetical protein